MEAISMKFDSKKLIAYILKIAVVVLIAKILAFVIELYTPAVGVDFSKDYNYKPKPIYINVSKVFGINKIKISTNKNQTTKPSYSMDEFILKGLYGNDKKGFIIIAKKSSKNKTKIISINQEYEGYKLVSIKINYVIFEKNNKQYKLKLNESKKDFGKNVTVSKPSNKQIVEDESIEVTQEQIKDYIAHPERIWRNIKIADYMQNGKLKGFKVKWIKKGTFLDKLGLKKGDIIIKANNIPLTSYKVVMDMYARWEELNAIALTIKRGNEEKELFYEIN
jgi:general secretion pathway protein C